MYLLRATWFALWFVGLCRCGGTTTGDGPAPGRDGSIGDGSSDDGALSCAERTATASALVKAAARAAEDDLSCQADEDCVIAWGATDCSDTCSEAVNRPGAEKIQAAVDDANGTVCRGFSEAGCTFARTPCAAPPPRWLCCSGECCIVLATR
jgi:hypothetical protein